MASLAAAGTEVLHGNVPEAVAISTALGPVSPYTRMRLAIGLPLRNKAELDTFLQELADPASQNFRRYLTPVQFTERFGPSQEDYQELAAFMRANGLQVTGTHPNRMILDVGGTVADVESTFHIRMMNWRHPTRGDFFAPDREPSLDAGMDILDISGLDNFAVPRPMDLRAVPLAEATPLTTGSGPGGFFIGNDFRAAYAPGVTLNGARQAVGLFELDGFYASDVAANFAQAGLPPVPTQTVLLDDFNGQPGWANIEVTLDIMMAAYMAPGVSGIIVYEGTFPNDVLNRMATDNLASQLSSSWCFSPTNATTDQIFEQMIAQGQSMFQASGDSGGYTGWIMPPADDPNITIVGGTSLTTAGAGGPWQSETAWSGSGGGISTVWAIPSYQQAVNMTAAGGSTTMRNIPDVALLADIQIYLICDDGQAMSIGGTSAATPLWAGFLALANQQAAANGKPRVGFLNPAIYPIGLSSGFHSDLHDITTGNNGKFSALPGYDLATGWGTPAGQPLINGLTGVSNPPPAFTLSASTSAPSVRAGGSASATITVNPENGFSEAVSLAVSGLPTGVTGEFSPAAATSTSTLTLSASSSAPAATSTVTIAGAAGQLTATTRVTLTVTDAPVLSGSSLSPSAAAAGGPGFTLTVNGTGFVTGAMVMWNGTAVLTSFVSTTQLTAWVPSALIASAGTATLTVVNPGGVASGGVSFPIEAATLAYSLTLNVSGLGFLAASPQPGSNGLYASGSYVCLTATPSAGWVFSSWSGSTLNTSNCLVMNGSASVTAIFVSAPLSFVPMPPCRVVDTRNPTGPFGGPSINAGTARSFTLPGSTTCNIPAGAAAYSLNVTVAPPGPLDYITVWPSGAAQPVVSTLNSLDGRIKANAAIIPAGTNGAVSVYATNTTDLILDIDGYFVPAGSDASALAFYPLTPCRVADTRYSSFGSLGPPSLSAGQSRSFDVLSSACNVPSTAQAYSLNFTVVPSGPVNYITTYPTGQAQPLASTLNDMTGTVTANAAMVPAGIGGAVSVYSYSATDLLIDIDGYFAPPATDGLSLYNLTPCRVLDSRVPSGTPPFTGEKDVNVTGSGCGAPSSAQAHVFNATVVPPGPMNYLTLWPQGGTMPVVSTLNAMDGAVTSNMALVPTNNGSISAYVDMPETTYLILDIFGYFAP
jgi:hypothetical protein